MKRFASLILAALLLLTLAVPVLGAADAGKETVILYTNDVHGYIAEPVGYAAVAALKKQYEAQGKNVILVDAGDFMQGTVYASMDEGKTIVRLMKEAGYDLGTFGNHEFDYGYERLLRVPDEAGFPFVCCNLFRRHEGKRAELVAEPYKVFDLGGIRVAFVGILTPTSAVTVAEKYRGAGPEGLDIGGAGDPSEFYALVQSAVDAARKEADYVIGLAHLGEENPNIARREEIMAYSAEYCIANVSGFDAMIDGHSHTVNPGSMLKDKSGKDVLITQAGTAFAYIGCMTISSKSGITTELLSLDDPAEYSDAKVRASVDAWIKTVQDSFGIDFCETEIGFTIVDAEGKRLVRKSETNLADLCADAVYYTVNKASDHGCDVAFVNGGGVRISVDPGAWNSLTLRSVFPFENRNCIAEMPGRVLREALEFSLRNMPETEFGGLLHSAGLKYEIHTYIPSTVQVDGYGNYAGPPTGAYRVRNIRVFDRDLNAYVPLDLDKTYLVAGANYILIENGDGHAEFGDPSVRLVNTSVSIDWLALYEYLDAFADTDGDGLKDIASRNSPLADLTNYLMNYESPTGSRRIRMITPEPRTGGNRTLLITVRRGS